MPSSYTLGDHFERFIQQQLRSGRYTTASEVIRDGLRLLEEAQQHRQAELAGLRARGDRPSRRGTANSAPGYKHRQPKGAAK